MSTRLQLLGGLAVEQAGKVQQLALERPVSLLVYLALRGDWVSRSELVLIYRPDSPSEAALRYIRTIVHRARSLPWAAGMEAEADRIRWLPQSDVKDFRAAVAERNWPEALSLYKGPFLDGARLPDAPGFESWQELERADMQTAWGQASQSQAALLLGQGRNAEAVRILQPLVQAEPLDEGTLQQFLRALAADGRQHEAVTAFDRFRKLLAEEVDGQPLESTLVLVDALQQLPEPRESRSALPEPTTSFVGREAELERINVLLHDGASRLITIQGMGGSGKTRLAIEAAGRHVRDSGQQAVFVPLAGLSSPDRLALTILETLGARAEDEDAERALSDRLRGSSQLLLLDNFEDVIEAAPLLVRLLAAAPDLRLLVTSRESLQVSDEFTLELAGLGTPHGESAQLSDAVQLFIARAARHGERFSSGGRALESITQICDQLEGLPLAIEIAASWTRLLSVRELSAQLAERETLLETDLRDLPERHRSIWSILGHTWQGLTDAQRQAMIRLSVFTGGFTLEAARLVAVVDLDLLLSLLDSSLVRRTGQDRFTVHELLRQYAARQAAVEQLASARAAHANYYCELLGQIGIDLKGRDVQRGLERVQADRANFELAWNHATATLNLTALEQAREALDHYLYYRARFQAARDYFSAAIAALEPLASDESAADQPGAARLRANLIAQQAESDFNLGELTAAISQLREALATLKTVGSETELATARLVLANGLHRTSQYEEARELFGLVLSSSLKIADAYLEGAARNGLATISCTVDGEISKGEEQYHLSLVAHRRVGNAEGVTGALTNLGACRFDLGDHTEAERLWTQAAEMCRELGFAHREAALLNNLGAVAEVRGDFAAAHELLERSLAVRRELGNIPGVAAVLSSLGRLALQQSQGTAARARLQEALELYGQLADPSGSAHCHSYMSRALLLLERHADAAREVARAIELSLDIGSHTDLLSALYSGALLKQAQGEAVRAGELASVVAENAAGNNEPLRTVALRLLERMAADPGSGHPPLEQYARRAFDWFTAA